MIPKDRRTHERRPRGKMKENGAEPSRRPETLPPSAIEGSKKSYPDSATLDLRVVDFELLAGEKRGSSLPAAVQGAGRASLVPLRSRMVAWARRIASRLSEFGIDVEATWSDEEPITRQPAAQPRKTGTASIVFHAPVRKNAILALRLRANVVEVSVEIYPSVHARAVSGEIAQLFDPLPDQFSVGRIEKIQGEERIPTREASANDVRALFEGDGGLWLGWSVPREIVLKHAALVGEQLGDAVIALSPVFALVTEIAVAPGSFARTLGPSRSKGRTRPALGASSGRSRGRVPAPLEKGSVVRVLSGPFVGKTGVIQELDGRGAKVMLGLLATRVAVADLALSTDGPNRPILSSSHRRPLGAR